MSPRQLHPDENTPLIPARSTSPRRAHGLSTQPLDSVVSQSLPTSIPPGWRSRRSSSTTSRADEVDYDELRLDLARVRSNGSLNIAASTACQPPTRLPAIPKTPDDLEASKNGDCNHDTNAVGGEDTCKEDKFMNISTRDFYLVFFAIVLNYFLACFDTTLMASAHPVISSDFGVSEAASWLSTVSLITCSCCQPLFGRMSDIVGRRIVFVVALVLLSLTTLWCALAGSFGSFLAARAVGGIGAGGTISLAMIVVSDCVRLERRGVYQSQINLAFGFGCLSGAAFGGYLCDTIGWRWAFGFQVPIMAFSIVIVLMFTPRQLGPMFMDNHEGGPWGALKNFDFAGSGLLVITVTSLIMALDMGGNIFPWISSPVIACFVIFAITCPAFLYNETIAMQPLMPLKLMTKTPIANLVYINVFGLMAVNTVIFNIPLFYQAVLLTSASDSGLRLAIPACIGSFAGVVAGYSITYTQRLKPSLVAGACFYVAGSFAICFIDKTVSELGSMAMLTVMLTGQGFTTPTAFISALAVSEPGDQAMVTGALGLFRNLGLMLGVSISSLVFQNALNAQLDLRVTGRAKQGIIERVRESVRSIRYLEGDVKFAVIDAYAQSLRLTFVVAAVCTVLVFLLVVPIRLPRLTRRAPVAVAAE